MVVDKAEYVDTLQAEVEGDRSYEEADSGNTKGSIKEIKKMMSKMYKEVKELKQYLILRYYVAGKLHNVCMPYRTTVNGIGTATERLAEVAEKELYEFVVSSPSYLRDTTYFLNKLQDIPRSVPNRPSCSALMSISYIHCNH